MDRSSSRHAVAILPVAVAACVTLYLVARLSPSSARAFLLISAWMLAPHLAMVAALSWLRGTGRSSWPWDALTLVVSTGGILFLVDVIFWHPDAQGGIAVLMTPILQGLAALLLSPIARWASRRAGVAFPRRPR
jgi:hypothetical protein